MTSETAVFVPSQHSHGEPGCAISRQIARVWRGAHETDFLQFSLIQTHSSSQFRLGLVLTCITQMTL